MRHKKKVKRKKTVRKPSYDKLYNSGVKAIQGLETHYNQEPGRVALMMATSAERKLTD